MSPLVIKVIDTKGGKQMERRIAMSIKELSRLDELTKTHEKWQTIRQTANNLGLRKRHALRLSKSS